MLGRSGDCLPALPGVGMRVSLGGEAESEAEGKDEECDKPIQNRERWNTPQPLQLLKWSLQDTGPTSGHTCQTRVEQQLSRQRQDRARACSVCMWGVVCVWGVVCRGWEVSVGH